MGIDLTYTADGRPGFVHLVARRDGAIVQADHIDILRHDLRTQFVRRLLDTAPEVDAVALEERILSIVDELASGGKSETIQFRTFTAAELDAASFPIEFLIEGTLVSGQPCIIAGQKKVLKTSVALDLALSLATATPFLGALAVPRPVPVGMMSGESGMSTIQETCRRIIHEKGGYLADVQNFVVSDAVPKLGDMAHEDAVKRLIETHKLEVLIVDPAYLALPGGDAGNLFIQGALLRGISETCQAAGCAMILVHHCKKNVATLFEPPELESIAWAGFQEFARQWLLLGRREPYEPGSGMHRLWLNVGGSVGHSALWAMNIEEGVYDGTGGRYWLPSLSKPREARRDVEGRQTAARQAERAEQVDVDRAEIVQVAFKAGPSTKRGLRDVATCGHRRFDLAFASLVQDGTLQTTTIKRSNGREYEGWRLTDDNQI